MQCFVLLWKTKQNKTKQGGKSVDSDWGREDLNEVDGDVRQQPDRFRLIYIIYEYAATDIATIAATDIATIAATDIATCVMDVFVNTLALPCSAIITTHAKTG
eukprot:COSAG06_NODE_2445_length_6866_cov_9.468450_5_plen_103_part_00